MNNQNISSQDMFLAINDFDCDPESMEMPQSLIVKCDPALWRLVIKIALGMGNAARVTYAIPTGEVAMAAFWSVEAARIWGEDLAKESLFYFEGPDDLLSGTFVDLPDEIELFRGQDGQSFTIRLLRDSVPYSTPSFPLGALTPENIKTVDIASLREALLDEIAWVEYG